MNKKPITSKWWFWAIIVIVVIGGIGSLFSDTDTERDDTYKPTETETQTETQTESESTLKDELGLVWFGKVNDDVTGNWRLSEYASATSLEEVAVQYYNDFFESDDEIHAVINMSTKVTGKITKIDDNTLDVSLYEYVDGEEHSAKELFGGQLLKQYLVTISDGTIEEIQ